MKRIIAVIPQYLGGGAETVTDCIVANLPKEDYEVILITGKIIEGCRERVNRLYRGVVKVDFPLAHYSEATTALLAAHLQKLNGDVLWLIGDDYANIPILRQALRPGAKIIYHLHSTPFFQIRLKDSFHGENTHSVNYVKWFLFKHMRQKLFRSYDRRYRNRTRHTANDVDYFVTLCNGYSRQLAEIYPEYASKFISIYNPAPESPSHADKQKTMVFLGRLSRSDKRVDLLLHIFARITDAHPDWTLKIVGDGPERQNLINLANHLDIERIEFTGFTDNPAPILDSASIICMTSEVEGWPMALVEGMQHGLAPIAFNCSAGVAELLADGRGILVEPHNLDTYANRLSELMDSPELRNRILAAHPGFLSSLRVNNIIPQWQKIFD